MELHETDHDRLIITMQAVKAQAEAFSTHIKEGKERFDDHVEDNKEDFDRLYSSLGKLEKIVWIVFGIGIALQGFPLLQTILKVINP